MPLEIEQLCNKRGEVMSDKFRAKLILIHDIESILKIKFKGTTEREVDSFIEKYYVTYKLDKEHILRYTCEFIEEGW